MRIRNAGNIKLLFGVLLCALSAFAACCVECVVVGGSFQSCVSSVSSHQLVRKIGIAPPQTCVIRHLIVHDRWHGHPQSIRDDTAFFPKNRQYTNADHDRLSVQKNSRSLRRCEAASSVATASFLRLFVLDKSFLINYSVVTVSVR